MSGIAFQITSNSTICSTAYWVNKKNISKLCIAGPFGGKCTGAYVCIYVIVTLGRVVQVEIKLRLKKKYPVSLPLFWKVIYTSNRMTCIKIPFSRVFSEGRYEVWWLPSEGGLHRRTLAPSLRRRDVAVGRSVLLAADACDPSRETPSYDTRS